jgi:biopolymer transport protein ExbB/TolQ
MDLAAAITQKDKTSATEGRIRKELKRELATERSYRILKKSRERKNLPKIYRSTYPSDNQPTTLQQNKQRYQREQEKTKINEEEKEQPHKNGKG